MKVITSVHQDGYLLVIMTETFGLCFVFPLQ